MDIVENCIIQSVFQEYIRQLTRTVHNNISVEFYGMTGGAICSYMLSYNERELSNAKKPDNGFVRFFTPN